MKVGELFVKLGADLRYQTAILILLANRLGL
jgi:hypothetical protein